MTIEDRIEALFGKDVLAYYKNKQTGGNSNQKGSRYEDFFSVMQLAELFYTLCTEAQHDSEIQAQASALVDDLLIFDKLKNIKHHFQLKNTSSIKWGDGNKSIGDDFYKQKLLNDDAGIENTRTTLVCSNQDKVNELTALMPIEIIAFSTVVFFPNVETVNQLLFEHKEFKNRLKTICFSDESDKLEALATIILGHWCDKKTTICSVRVLFSELQNRFPNYLAQIDAVIRLLPEVDMILSKIEGFSYVLEKGYFNWSYSDGLDSGNFMYPIGTKEFNNLQQKIIAQQPSQFSELENLLLWTDNSQNM